MLSIHRNAKNNWETLRQSIEKEFIEILKDCFKEDLHAVILYGSAARGAYRAGISDVNLLILYTHSDSARLFRFGDKAKVFIRKHNITPLLMSREEFLNSADVFPLEYIDLQNAYKILYGTDDTPALDLKLQNLRHQAEERLRGSLNQLRQLLVASTGKSKNLAAFLKSWSSGSNALFRALLILKSEDPNVTDPEALLLKVGVLYNVSMEAFSEFERFRRGEKLDPLALTGKLLQTLESIVKAVDTLKENKL